MSKIEELINKLCPNGVEYKTIGEICNNIFSGGTPKTSNDDYYGGNIPWLRSGEINFNEIKDAEIKITEKGLNESSAKWIKSKSVLIALTGATVARCAVNEIALTANQSVCAMEVSDKVNYKFLYYTIANKYNEIKGMAQGALTSINLNIIKSIKIAVPPMEVQNEIVHILDDFTLLSAELSAELKVRKKQYQYYLDYYFDLENKKDLDGKVYLLEDLGDIVRGKRFVHADAVEENGIPAIHYGELYTYYGVSATTTKSQIRKDIPKNLRYAQKNDVVIVGAGENDIDIGIGVSWQGDYEVAIHDACYIFHPNKKILSKYLSFYLRSSMYHKQIKKYVSKGKICAISAQGIGKSAIYVPSIDEQERIINILEKFDELNENNTGGIPAEIEARKKQYEYYRNILLKFNK